MPVTPVNLADTQTSEALPAAPRDKWAYIHYPDDPGNWFVGEVGGRAVWLPRLQTFRLTPGASGVRTLERGEHPSAAYVEAFATLRRRGATVLEPMSAYLRAWPARHPVTGVEGYIYTDHYTTPRVGKGRKTGVVKFHVDRDARNAWLYQLVADGEIAPPDPDIVDQAKAAIIARIVRRAAEDGVVVTDDYSGVAEGDRVSKALAGNIARLQTAEVAEVPVSERRGPAPRPPRRPTPPAKPRSVTDV